MPKNFNSKDISILSRLGIVSEKDGVYTVTRAVAGHKPNETISESRAIELASFFTPPMSDLDRTLVAVFSPSSSSQEYVDYPDYEGDDLEDAENEDDDD